MVETSRAELSPCPSLCSLQYSRIEESECELVSWTLELQERERGMGTEAGGGLGGLKTTVFKLVSGYRSVKYERVQYLCVSDSYV